MSSSLRYPDLDTFLRGYLAAGPIVSAIRTLGEKPVRDALIEGVRPDDDKAASASRTSTAT